MAFLTVPLIFLCWIRKLKYLSPVSLISNTLQSASLVLIFYYLFQDLPPVESRPAVGSLSKWPLYFGTAVFAFEGISLVLPLQKNMRTPQDFRGWNGVLNTGMIIVTVLYFAVGFYGYLKYGDDIKGSITLNLPSGDMYVNYFRQFFMNSRLFSFVHWIFRLAQIVKLMMALAIFGSYAVQYFVVSHHEIFLESSFNQLPSI
jgi:solute carrier family 36 (proton-coupled amino acid transporter)